MSPKHSIPSTDEAWDTGQLGNDEASVEVAPDDEALINEALGLQPISIRLEKSLIEDFKMIAELHGLGYQPLMRQALRRFADCEKKRLLRDALENAKRVKAGEPAKRRRAPSKAKKAA